MKHFRLAMRKGFIYVVKFDKAEHLIPYVWLIRYCAGVAVRKDELILYAAPSELRWQTQTNINQHFPHRAFNVQIPLPGLCGEMDDTSTRQRHVIHHVQIPNRMDDNQCTG